MPGDGLSLNHKPANFFEEPGGSKVQAPDDPIIIAAVKILYLIFQKILRIT